MNLYIFINHIRLEPLKILGVEPRIAKLFMSKNVQDFLVAWELVTDHPNCDYIRAYCKGCTNIVPGLEDYWDEKAKYYYNDSTWVYTFGDITIKSGL